MDRIAINPNDEKSIAKAAHQLGVSVRTIREAIERAIKSMVDVGRALSNVIDELKETECERNDRCATVCDVAATIRVSPITAQWYQIIKDRPLQLQSGYG